MFELFILIVLVALVVWLIRGGSVAGFDNPVIIQIDGLYHATISPQLVQSQFFIEQIVAQFGKSDLSGADIATQCFEVHDAQLRYLLAVSLRGGILYFQVISPAPLLNAAHYETLQQFSAQVMIHHPLVLPVNEQGGILFFKAVEAAANQLQVSCLHLHQNNENALCAL